MKKYYIIILIGFVCVSLSGFAQTDAQRTNRTKVVDALALMPAQNASTYNSLMKDLASTGEEGVNIIVRMMNDNLSGDNSIMQYAINGLSYYVAGLNDENTRLRLAIAYTKAIPQISNVENRSFFISQLQIIGKDETVPILYNLLRNESSCEPAARALAAIKTVPARKALTAALTVTQDACRISVIQAIGDAGATEAEQDILKILGNTSNPALQKVALTTLAKIGGKASLKTLASEAMKSGYLFDKSNATEAYISLIKRLWEDPSTKSMAEKEAQAFYKKCQPDKLKQTRMALLQVMVDMQKERALPLIYQSLTDSDPMVRNTALSFAGTLPEESFYNQFMEILHTAANPAKIDIINYLGEHRIQAAAATLSTYVQESEDLSVRQAAIKALGLIGGETVVYALADVFRKNIPDDIQAAKLALLSTKTDIAPAMDAVRFEASVPGSAALITIAGARHLENYADTIFQLAKSGQPELKNAAVHALPNIATIKDTSRLFAYLEEAGDSDIPVLQGAVLASLASLETPGQTDVILHRMKKIPHDTQMRYYNILAKIGDEKGLEIVYKTFSEQNAKAKDAAFAALLQWNGLNAMDRVFDICKDNTAPGYFDKAFASYVSQVNKSGYPAMEKVLLLRKAMEVAKTTEQKRSVIKSLEQNKTFTSLMFAGKYLDDPALGNDAAWAVANIALANTGFYGTEIKDMLNKAMNVISGPDSDYTKTALVKHLAEMPQTEGFVSLFNGKDLTGWKGLVGNPITRQAMDDAKLKAEQVKADDLMRKGWSVHDGLLQFNGKGDNICTVKQYGDFEMYVDWLLYPDSKEADAGIYLRGTPQVQIWDIARYNVGAEVGSGGLYNNKINPSKPLSVADNKLGEWNSFYIKMVGDRVTVYLNGVLVADNVIMENYWNANLPIFPVEQIELQAHGSRVAYRDIYIREIPRREPFALPADEQAASFHVLFDGTNMHEWIGNTKDYVMEDGCIVIYPNKGSGGNLYTKKEYKNFNFRFEFMLTPGANNGVGIRTPLEGDAAYVGMEIQILDNDAPIYRDLAPYQYHGSVYGIIPALRGYLKPIGEWNQQEIIVNGSRIIVLLNGKTILDGDIAKASANGTMDGRDHPGLKNEKGHIGFLGHGSVVKFRNIRIKEL